jgi:zinc D-Ala-D-Ala carboxypeptidase
MRTSRPAASPRQYVAVVAAAAFGFLACLVAFAWLVRPVVAHPATASSSPSGHANQAQRPAPEDRRQVETRREGRPDRFDRHAHSTTDPSSIWVIVNKTHPLLPWFRPKLTLVRGYQVAVPAADPLEQLLMAAHHAGVDFKIASAFRSYDYQRFVHADIVATEGVDEADRISARAGYSEHQTGLAMDLVTPGHPGCDFEPCFATTPGGRWLSRHAWRFGFIVRYTRGDESVTGYAPEPWHIRFVGRALSTELHRTHTPTLEQFFGVTGGAYPTHRS